MTKTTTKNRKPIFFAVAAVCMLIAILSCIYLAFRPNAVTGNKEITVEIVYPEGNTEAFIIHTDAEYLEQAILECEGIMLEGSRTQQFGLMIEAVNGIEADYVRDHAYWAVERNGETCNYGVSQQPIYDGEVYRLIYTAVDAL